MSKKSGIVSPEVAAFEAEERRRKGLGLSGILAEHDVPMDVIALVTFFKDEGDSTRDEIKGLKNDIQRLTKLTSDLMELIKERIL